MSTWNPDGQRYNIFEGNTGHSQNHRGEPVPQDEDKNVNVIPARVDESNTVISKTREVKKHVRTMSETPVSFVVGDPDPCEELENEDSFPSDGNDGIQQQPLIVPGLVERRKRLR